MGSLMADIKRTGRLVLTSDGRIEIIQDRQDGREHVKIGELVVGIDGLYIDGVEPIFTQRNDPAKLRLAARYDDGKEGLSGVVSFNRLRSDDRMEERVMLQGGQAEDFPQSGVDDRGEFKIQVRRSAHPEDWGVGFVATTAHSIERWGHRRLWTGAATLLGWLWKYANKQPDDLQSEAVASSAASSFMRSPNGRWDFECQDDGNFVVYDEANGHTPVFDRFSIEARLKAMEDRFAGV